MKKQLNANVITNELRGNSAFFPIYKEEQPEDSAQKPAPLAPASPRKQASPDIPVPQGVPPPVPPAVPLIPKVKRPIKQRQPFDIYEDQYARLKKIADAEKDYLNGRGMSQMVRDAIDDYLRDHTTPEE